MKHSGVIKDVDGLEINLATHHHMHNAHSKYIICTKLCEEKHINWNPNINNKTCAKQSDMVHLFCGLASHKPCGGTLIEKSVNSLYKNWDNPVVITLLALRSRMASCTETFACCWTTSVIPISTVALLDAVWTIAANSTFCKVRVRRKGITNA